MTNWVVYSDENEILGTIVADDRLTAQDRAQEITDNAIGVWIERDRLGDEES